MSALVPASTSPVPLFPGIPGGPELIIVLLIFLLLVVPLVVVAALVVVGVSVFGGNGDEGASDRDDDEGASDRP